jgi:hypothetical protein
MTHTFPPTGSGLPVNRMPVTNRPNVLCDSFIAAAPD